MITKQLPELYIFNPSCLDNYKPGMELPKFDYSDGKTFVVDTKHPLAEFLAYYFRLIDRPQGLFSNAHREKIVKKLCGVLIPDDDGSLRAEFEGSIALLKAYRGEVVKTRGYALQKGWHEKEWPVNCLEGIIEECDEELKRIETPIKLVILSL